MGDLLYERWAFHPALVRLFFFEEWPRKWRRLFIMALPISLPIYCVLFALLIILPAPPIILADIVLWFFKLWRQP